MKDCIIKGLEYWYKVDPYSGNWWPNQIGKQQSLGPFGVLMKQHLSTD